MLFGSHKMLTKCSQLSLQVQGKNIRHVESMKYLGMLLDPNLKWNLHRSNVYSDQQIHMFIISSASYN